MHRRMDKALAEKLTDAGLGSAPWVPDHGCNIRDYDMSRRARLDLGCDECGIVLLAVLISSAAYGDARLAFEVEDHVNINFTGEPKVKSFESIFDALAHLDAVNTRSINDSSDAARAKAAADAMVMDSRTTIDAVHKAIGTATTNQAARDAARGLTIHVADSEIAIHANSAANIVPRVADARADADDAPVHCDPFPF